MPSGAQLKRLGILVVTYVAAPLPLQPQEFAKRKPCPHAASNSKQREMTVQTTHRERDVAEGMGFSSLQLCKVDSVFLGNSRLTYEPNFPVMGDT